MSCRSQHWKTVGRENSFSRAVVGNKHGIDLIDFKTNLRLEVSDRQGKNVFEQESFYLQGIFSCVNESDTHLLLIVNTNTYWKMDNLFEV